MIKGKTLTAGNLLIEELKNTNGKKIFIIGTDGKVKSDHFYKLQNYICKPGKEVFILMNEKTGKIKRAKKIFCIHTSGDM